MDTKQILTILLTLSTFGTLALVVKMRLDQKNIKPPVAIPDNEEIVSVSPQEFFLDDAVNSIKKDKLKKDLYYLASTELEGRMSGKKGNVTAADFIKKEFDRMGLDSMYHKFPIERKNPGPKNEIGDGFTQNVYGWIEGNDPLLKDEIVVIGAHMDHIGYGPSMSRDRRKMAVHPGADDNASGTVALLEIAEAFSLLKNKVRRTVVFQAYSAEEMGLLGSRYYCNNPTFPIDDPDINKHVFMLNMDMVGHLGRGVYFAGFDASPSSIDVGKKIKELDGKYDFASRITSRGTGGSDHACFYNRKIPVAFLHTGLHPYYHKPVDTPDKINYEGLESISRYAFELSWKIAQTNQPPRFNTVTFKELPYLHDHGSPETPFVYPYQNQDHGHDHDLDDIPRENQND